MHSARQGDPRGSPQLPLATASCALALVAGGFVAEAYFAAVLPGSGAMLVGGAIGSLLPARAWRLGLAMAATLGLLAAPHLAGLGDDALFANACALVALWMGSALASPALDRAPAAANATGSPTAGLLHAQPLFVPRPAVTSAPAPEAAAAAPDAAGTSLRAPATPGASEMATAIGSAGGDAAPVPTLAARIDALLPPGGNDASPRQDPAGLDAAAGVEPAAAPGSEHAAAGRPPSHDAATASPAADVEHTHGAATATATTAIGGTAKGGTARGGSQPDARRTGANPLADIACLPLPTGIVGADGRVLAANAALGALAGPLATAGTPFAALFDVEDAAVVAAALDGAGGDGAERHVAHAALSGGTRVALHAARTEPCGSTCVVCVPLAQSSEALRLRAFAAHAALGVLVVDDAGRIVHASEAAGALLGMHAAGLRTLPLRERVHRVDQERLDNALRLARQVPHAPAEARLRLLGGSGEVVEVAATFTGHPRTPGVHGTVVNLRDLTEVAALDRTLREHEDRIALLFRETRDAMAIVARRDRVVLDANPAFLDLCGTTRAQAIGQRIDDLPGLAGSTTFAAWLARLERLDVAVDGVVDLCTADGSVHTRDATAHLFDHGGELASLVCLRAGTAATPADAALRESEERFTRVFRAVPDAILITRLSDHLVIDANDRCCEAGGFARADVIGRSGDDLALFSRGVLDRTRALLERYGSCRDLDVTLATPEGPMPALLSATLVDLGGEPCAVTMARDLRAQVLAENALRRSEARFRNAFANAPMGFALVNADLTLADGNVCLADMLGVAVETLAGRSLLDLFLPTDRADLAGVLATTWTGGGEPLRREQRIRRADGAERVTTLHAVAERDEHGATRHLIVQLADITDIRASQAQMERLAFYDALTDLANRRLLMDRLGQTVQHAARQATPASLLYLDLDKFKRVNDTLGHEAGDALLKAVAERLRRCVRRDDTVARLGGDEFTVLLHDVRDAEGAAHVAEHVLEALRAPLHLHGEPFEVTTSIGIAMIPDDGTDPSTLLQRADQAMYRAKQQGRNTYRFFGDAINARAAARLTLESSLERAVARGELALFYQPVIRLDDGSVDSVEALLRWQHPERGLIEPAGFLALSDRIGLIRSLDAWALGEALRQLADFDRAGLGVPAIAVNVSLATLRDDSLPERIRSTLARHGIEPHRLQLEIAEAHITRDIDGIEPVLAPLRDLGVTLTLDDFGNGVTSLAAIAHLPVQRVKLDGALVSRLPSSREAQAIVEHVVGLCGTLGRDAIGEAVETLEQRLRLGRSGCRFGQGHLFGLPCTAIELVTRLPARHEPPPLQQAV